MKRTIATIGYEGSDLESFIEALLVAEIEVLIDVREVALSRKKGFSKNGLRSALERNGISYLHLRGLGDPKEGRLAARSGDYDGFRRIFHQHLRTDEARSDLEKAKTLVKSAKICLMCFESDPLNCHRRIVAEKLAITTNAKIEAMRLSTSKIPQLAA
jgi:uncharacterized protein (DUF488 family)